MLLHLTPRFLTCKESGQHCEIVDVRIPELGLYLRGGLDITSRTPYANRRLLAASRKSSGKSLDGILIETAGAVTEFTAINRWAVKAEVLVTHRIRYVLKDAEGQAASDNMLLWPPEYWAKRQWGAKDLIVPPDWTPSNTQPRMDFAHGSDRRGEILDTIVDGIVVERRETIHLPAIERAHLVAVRPVWTRLPPLETAYQVAASGRASTLDARTNDVPASVPRL
jgi:hypothetical protein